MSEVPLSLILMDSFSSLSLNNAEKGEEFFFIPCFLPQKKKGGRGLLGIFLVWTSQMEQFTPQHATIWAAQNSKVKGKKRANMQLSKV